MSKDFKTNHGMVFALLLAAMAGVAAPASAAKRFTDVAGKAGLTHRHYAPVLDKKLDNIMSWVTSVGAAAAAGDFDRDGYMDLYVTNSRKGQPNYLYHNNGDGTFTDVAQAAGVGDVNGAKGTSMDCVWGDVDNDGWLDLYVVRWGEDILFRNLGDGIFKDVTASFFRKRDGSPGTQWANGNAALFLDYNMDGLTDIYVGNYFREIDLWNLESTRIMHDDFEKARNGGLNYLYRQNADGTFTELAEELGLDDRGWTLAVGSADLNNDGRPDLYCADDFGPDQLFLNAGDGKFTNVTEHAIGFDSKKGMNIDFGDFNNDGWMDGYVANITTAEYLQEGNMLWHNNGPSRKGGVSLIDVSLETGTYDGGWGWGAKFFDYDNDADLDIVAVNGFISAGEGDYWYDLASWTVTGEDAGNAKLWPTIGTRSFSGYESTRLFRNNGFSSFSQVASDLGIGDTTDGRGVVCFDFDNDGDLDVYVANQGQPPHLYRNDNLADNNWLMIELQASPKTGTTRDGLGTRVTLVGGQETQIRERDGGNGYSGQSDSRIHFGLGKESFAKLLEIRWPDGGLQYIENVAANQHIRVDQDPSQYAAQLAVAVKTPAPWRKDTAAPKTESASAKIDSKRLNAMLSDLEARIEDAPDDHVAASQYRVKCTTFGKHSRSNRFLEKIAKAHPDSTPMQIELACSFVDKIPTCGGLAAIVSKGSLAKKSLDILDKVIEKDSDLWLAYYCRGMNHLHWPRALRHSDDAVADFETCIRLQEKSASVLPYHVRTYIALGDSYAKLGDPDKARKTWRDGMTRFAGNDDLKQRLAIEDDDALFDFVMQKRSLEHEIDTDLSFVAQQDTLHAAATAGTH